MDAHVSKGIFVNAVIADTDHEKRILDIRPLLVVVRIILPELVALDRDEALDRR
jgi:hypothetical protein